jgi:hypothetical protein
MVGGGGGVWASLRYSPRMGGRSCMRLHGWWIIHSRRWVYASFVVRGCSLELFWCVLFFGTAVCLASSSRCSILCGSGTAPAVL